MTCNTCVPHLILLSKDKKLCKMSAFPMEGRGLGVGGGGGGGGATDEDVSLQRYLKLKQLFGIKKLKLKNSHSCNCLSYIQKQMV